MTHHHTRARLLPLSCRRRRGSAAYLANEMHMLQYCPNCIIMGKKQANKDRKATEDAIVAGAKVPRSFVIHRGRVPRSMRILEKDLRQLMMPYTAKALRESDKNVMKDFVAIAGPLNVSHMMCLSHSDSGTSTLRVCRFPRGPTLYFKLESYSLCRDIISRQRHPFSPGKAELLHSPLVVLNSMQNADKHVQVGARAGCRLQCLHSRFIP